MRIDHAYLSEDDGRAILRKYGRGEDARVRVSQLGNRVECPDCHVAIGPVHGGLVGTEMGTVCGCGDVLVARSDGKPAA
jgi:hypothetical protein